VEYVNVRKVKLQFNRLGEFHMCVEFPIVDMKIVMWSNIAIFLELKKVTAKTKSNDDGNEALMTPLIFNIRPFEPAH